MAGLTSFTTVDIEGHYGLLPLEHCSSSGSESDFFTELATQTFLPKAYPSSTPETIQFIATDPFKELEVVVPSGNTTESSEETPRSCKSLSSTPRSVLQPLPEEESQSSYRSSPRPCKIAKLEQEACSYETKHEEGINPGPFTLATLPLPPKVTFHVPHTTLDMPLPMVTPAQAMVMVGRCTLPNCTGMLCKGHSAAAVTSANGLPAQIEVVKKNVGALQALLPLLAPENSANAHQQAVALHGIQTIVQRLAACTAHMEVPTKATKPTDLEQENMALEVALKGIQRQLQQREEQLNSVHNGLSAMRKGLAGLQHIGVL